MKIVTYFWKIVGVFGGLNPKQHLPQFIEYPIARTNPAQHYDYPAGFKILKEWDEKGHHWIVFEQ